MKIMLFCYAEEMKIEISNWAVYLARLPHEFVIAPLVRLIDAAKYKEVISRLGQSSDNISVDPVYLRSLDSSFRNLVLPNVMLKDALSIFNVVKRSRPDAIVCFYASHAYPLAVLKRIFKFRLCVYALGSDINLENDLFHRLARNFTLGNCELVFSVSRKIKNKIEEDTGHSVMVIPSSTDLSFFRPLFSNMKLRRKWRVQTKRVILTVCRLHKYKGVDIVIKAFRTINYNDVDLLIVGDGVERKSLEKLSAVLGIKEKVKFLGFRNRKELLELYNIADLFVLASYSEGLPRVLIEAMGCGCIPLVTNAGDVTAVIRDGYNGFIVNPGDFVRIGERMTYIFSLPEQTLSILKDRARYAVMYEFDSEIAIRKMVESIVSL
jgi:glycosyltransferase involved in cell wall biosynthesis